MMAISQASVLVGDLRSLKMWDKKASARINPMIVKRCANSQEKFIALKSPIDAAAVDQLSPSLLRLYHPGFLGCLRTHILQGMGG